MFIVREGASCYYLANQSLGNAGEPKGHPSHTHSIIEKRGGHITGHSAILPDNLTSSHLPVEVRTVIKNLLDNFAMGM